jgi:superfamily I DNA and/or RNA helicase
LLTKFEDETLKKHIHEIESEVMKDYDIFVSTVGSLGDKRVQSCGSLSTVIIDEAGQLTQPAAIYPLTLNQKRTIIIGDHQQLRPQISSFAAESAGLEKSVMEWFEFG